MNVGHLAMRFLRIEKFIPFWGEELTSETTPFEVGFWGDSVADGKIRIAVMLQPAG